MTRRRTRTRWEVDDMSDGSDEEEEVEMAEVVEDDDEEDDNKKVLRSIRASAKGAVQKDSSRWRLSPRAIQVKMDVLAVLSNRH